jgi:hypothetical protein
VYIAAEIGVPVFHDSYFTQRLKNLTPAEKKRAKMVMNIPASPKKCGRKRKSEKIYTFFSCNHAIGLTFSLNHLNCRSEVRRREPNFFTCREESQNQFDGDCSPSECGGSPTSASDACYQSEGLIPDWTERATEPERFVQLFCHFSLPASI